MEAVTDKNQAHRNMNALRGVVAESFLLFFFLLFFWLHEAVRKFSNNAACCCCIMRKESGLHIFHVPDFCHHCCSLCTTAVPQIWTHGVRRRENLCSTFTHRQNSEGWRGTLSGTGGLCSGCRAPANLQHI